MKTLNELRSLEGRVSLVTGGGGHIGGAMAEALLELGSKVILLDVNEKNLQKKKEEFGSEYSNQISCITLNLDNIEEIEKLSTRIESEFGRLDILINSAAFVGETKLEGWVVPFKEQTIETWKKALDINLTAPFALIKSLATLLENSGHGSIINIGSTYGVNGPDMSIYEGTEMGNPAAYAASKGGIIQLTRWLATNMSPQVRVNSISPGGVERGQPESFQKKYISRTPLARMANEEDFKGAIAFLASDLSKYVTGQNLMIDGGWTVW